MPIDLMESLERDQSAFERMARSMEDIRDVLTHWVNIEQKRFDKEYPAKREPKDATITHIPTAEDRLKEEQGASEEPIEEWTGLREQEFIARQRSNKK